MVETFAALRAILEPAASELVVTNNGPDCFQLNAPKPWNNKPLYFGGAVIRKNYVSYYLMGVYMKPELLKNLSPALKKRMQGKSCFNFVSIDEEHLRELEQLTRKCLDFYRSEGYL